MKRLRAKAAAKAAFFISTPLPPTASSSNPGPRRGRARFAGRIDVERGDVECDVECVERMTGVPQDIDEIIRLYKYRSLRTPDQVEHARDILVNNRLYCTPPRKFDDPFELRARLSFEASDAEKVKRLVPIIRKRKPGISEEGALALVPDWIEHNERTGAQRMEDWGIADLGVVSLAGTRESLLMWSHYAAGHTGICIEFTAPRLRHAAFFAGAEAGAFPVNYQDAFPAINIYRDPREAWPRPFLFTKAKVWAYEREYRIIEQDRNATPHVEFAPDLISAVYLGCNISDDHAEQVKEWVRARGMPTRLFQARRAEDAYRLDFAELD